LRKLKVVIPLAWGIGSPERRFRKRLAARRIPDPRDTNPTENSGGGVDTKSINAALPR
jgi:hypothetical protein